MQDALLKVAGVTEVVTISDTDEKVVLKVEKGKVDTDTLIKTVEGVEEVDDKPRFIATVPEENQETPEENQETPEENQETPEETQ